MTDIWKLTPNQHRAKTFLYVTWFIVSKFSPEICKIQVKKIIKNQYLKENNQDGSRMDEVSWNVKLKASCKQEKNEHLTSGHIRMKLKHNKDKKNKW